MIGFRQGEVDGVTLVGCSAELLYESFNIILPHAEVIVRAIARLPHVEDNSSDDEFPGLKAKNLTSLKKSVTV